MKKKKIIVICIFSALILMTAILCLMGAIDSYRYDMDPANGIDIMQGMGAAMLLVLGGFVIFYELDLFYTVYYFLIKPKTLAKSILNLLSNVSLLLVFFTDPIARFLWQHVSDAFGEEGIVLFAFLGAYMIFRMIYLVISALDPADQAGVFEQ
ncbi:MAG: hypothetical protein IJX19_08450 [Clostridia bacterium]|nr:hypothetical protein [Clostridia bacterium]